MLIRLGLSDMKVVLRDTGELLKWSAITFFVPLITGIWFKENLYFILIYFLVGLFCFFLGTAMKRLFSCEESTDLKHAFMIVALIWLIYTAISAMPFSIIMEFILLMLFLNQ